MKSLDSFLLNVVRYGLFAVFALPFVVWLGHLYPWVTGKIIGFEVIIEVLFPFYVLLALRRQEFRPSKNPFLYAILAYFAVLTLSMLLGTNVDRSLWSKPDRLTGIYFQYHLLAFFLMAGAAWRKVLVRPVIASIVTAIILSFHAMIQVAFPAPGTDGRGSATLGNASYLGQYLVPHLFLCGWLVLRYWKTGLRWLWAVAGTIVLIGIFMTKSKGALVGIGIGIAVAALIAAMRGRARARKYSLAAISFLALVAVGYLAANQIGSMKRWLYQERLSIQYFQETSGSRKLLLENAVKGITQRPIFGWGLENFEDGYYFNYDPYTLRYSEYESRQDRPHNLVLEILHNLGLVGFLAYAAVFFFALRLMVPKSRADWATGAVLVIAAFSQVGTNLFIFETPMSYLALFFMLSLIAADIAGRETKEEGPDESSQAAVPICLLVAVVAVWCLRTNIAVARSANVTAKMIIALQQEGVTAEAWNGMLTELRSLKSPYYERDIRALASHLSQARGQYLEGPYKAILIDLAEDEYRRFQHNRRDYVHAIVTANAYLSFTPRSAEQQAALEDALQASHDNSPNRHEVESMLAQVAWEKGDLDEAEKHVQRIVDLDPGNVVGTSWWMRWQLEFRDPAEAARILKAHPDVRDYSDAWSQVEFGTLHLLQMKRWKDLSALYKASEENDVRNVQWDLTGAIAAWALGDKALSEKIINEARTLYPERLELINSIASQREEIVMNGG